MGICQSIDKKSKVHVGDVKPIGQISIPQPSPTEVNTNDPGTSHSPPKTYCKTKKNNDKSVFICSHNTFELQEFSTKYNKTTYNLQNLEEYDKNQVKISSDKKSLFISKFYYIEKFNIRTKKLITILNCNMDDNDEEFYVINEMFITPDDRFLFAYDQEEEKITKYDLLINKCVCKWTFPPSEDITSDYSLSITGCTIDSKYQLVCHSGRLLFWDIENHETAKIIILPIAKNNTYVLYCDKIVFTEDNLYAYFDDHRGLIRKLDIKNFEIIETKEFSIDYGSGETINAMCLTPDDKNIMVVINEDKEDESENPDLFQVYNLHSKKMIKEHKFLDLYHIDLTDNGKKACIIGRYGDVTLMDLKTLEITSRFEAVTTKKEDMSDSEERSEQLSDDLDES